MSEIQAGPTQEGQRKSLECCVAQDSLGEESNKETDENLWQKKRCKLWQKKSWRKLTWGLVHKDQGLSQLMQI